MLSLKLSEPSSRKAARARVARGLHDTTQDALHLERNSSLQARASPEQPEPQTEPPLACDTWDTRDATQATHEHERFNSSHLERVWHGEGAMCASLRCSPAHCKALCVLHALHDLQAKALRPWPRLGDAGPRETCPSPRAHRGNRGLSRGRSSMQSL